MPDVSPSARPAAPASPRPAPAVSADLPLKRPFRAKADGPFYLGLSILAGFYVALIVAMLLADVYYAGLGHFGRILASPNIQFAIKLSLLSCCVTTILAVWVAVPVGYLMSRVKFRGKAFVDAVLDIPIVLPPLVIGLSLLILFRQTPLRALDNYFGIAFDKPAVILAQFAVATAFAVRTMRATFDEMSPRQEQVALTLGCSRSQAFWTIVLPESRMGLLTAATLAWARSLGEFGPILVFAGSTRQRTEVLPVSVHLHLSIGDIEGAVAVSLLMILMAVVVLVVVRVLAGGDWLDRSFRGRRRSRSPDAPGDAPLKEGEGASHD
ncbi:MAG: ABC transporter permease [Planctomycetia bacterium]|nr:ABC transporter permease [Planctomycetia bacterium]